MNRELKFSNSNMATYDNEEIESVRETVYLLYMILLALNLIIMIYEIYYNKIIIASISALNIMLLSDIYLTVMRMLKELSYKKDENKNQNTQSNKQFIVYLLYLNIFAVAIGSIARLSVNVALEQKLIALIFVFLAILTHLLFVKRVRNVESKHTKKEMTEFAIKQHKLFTFLIILLLLIYAFIDKINAYDCIIIILIEFVLVKAVLEIELYIKSRKNKQ